MNSHHARRFAELVSEDYVQHNPAVAPDRSIDIWRFEDGRLVEHWDQLNLLEVFRRMKAVAMQGAATQ